MLQKLTIKNYAIIDRLEVVPDGQLNTITGETGAGKSIILGALSLILGERADTSVLINKDDKCVIEAVFDVAGNESFRTALLEADMDDDTQCIIRREISSAGKSRAFINDSPVTLDVLGKLTGMLVDLQQQFGHLALQEDAFQYDVIDAVAQNKAEREAYTTLYLQYKQVKASLDVLYKQQAQQQKDADYKQFLLNELEEANFADNEIEDAAQQLKQLEHAEKILSALQSSRYVLVEGDAPLVNELKKLVQQLQAIIDVLPDANAVQERISSALIDLKDVAGELERLESNVQLDDAKMQQMQERADAGYKLLKKHALQTTADLIALQQQLQQELQSVADASEKITTLEKELSQIETSMLQAAQRLSARRSAAIPSFAEEINKRLALVGMPNARMQVTLTSKTQPDKFGIDNIAFLFDANKSNKFLPVSKAASGGEMSRIMLCIKSLTASAMHLPTLIFDEVDTGISGEAARQVGILLHQLATHHQVICITHQPQVAAKGTTHFYVYKEEVANGSIQTRLKALDKEERITAIARMIGGDTPSHAAIANAKELVAA
ncbi:DNA repair protein RecN [Chitinophagaceae bacterium IBVUCB1]|nr:DNA repair protein RecN [Chitinophagaceae bacterium IBVUCB1]